MQWRGGAGRKIAAVKNGTIVVVLIGEVVVQKLAVRSDPSAPAEPVFGASLPRDAKAATDYFTAVEAALQSLKTEQQHGEAAELKTRSRAVRSASSAVMPSPSMMK